MDQWDPMKEAFENKHFNSYNEGVGRDLTGSHQRNSGVRLYVQNIPLALGKSGFYNLFAEYGKVLHHDMKISDNSEIRGCYGFVTMENLLDAETAISKLHKLRLGQFVLKVSPALTHEERNRRRQLKQNEMMFNRDSADKSNLQDRESLMNESVGPAKSSHGLEMSKADWHSKHQAVANCRGQKIPMTDRGDANQPGQGILSHNMGMGNQALGYNSSPVSSANYQRHVASDLINKRNYHGAGRGMFEGKYDTPQILSEAPIVKTCINCYRVGCEYKCSRCKMFYCSTECQAKDWSRHKDVCMAVGEMFQFDSVNSNGTNGNASHTDSSQNTYAKDREIPNNQMKMIDADQYGSSYSCPNLVETHDKRSHGENNFRSAHTGPSQFASKLKNPGDGHLRSNQNSNLTESKNFPIEKVPLPVSSDKTGLFQNAYKPQNSSCNPLENVLNNSESHRYNDEVPLLARATHSDLKHNKFQNNRNECEESNAFSINKTISQKYPQDKSSSSMNSIQERQFTNNRGTAKPKDSQRNVNTLNQDKTTSEATMGGPNSQNQSDKLGRRSGQLSTETTRQQGKLSGGMTTFPQVKSTSQTILELSLAVKTSGSCCLTYFESPYKFWISMQEFLETFVENTVLMEQISAMPASFHIDCKVGDVYGVFYMSEWCRVNVVSVKGRNITVFFVDYGNEDIVNLEDLRPLTKEMIDLPAQAVCCSVSKIRSKGSKPWSEAACNAVKDWLGKPMSALLQYEIIAKKGSLHFVNISHKNMSMRELLLSGGFAESINYEPDVPAVSKTEDHTPPRHMARELTSIMADKNVGDIISVVLTDFTSAKRIIVLDVASNDLLNEMSSLLQSEYADNNVPYRPVKGELVAAKFSEDEQWYRAEVTSIDGDSCAVFFVDYGNSDVQAVENIRPVTKQNLVAVPKQALICGLFVSQSLKDYDADIVEKEFHILLDASLNDEKQCTLQVKEKGKETLLVDFFSRSGAFLSEMLARRLSEQFRDSLHQMSPRQTHNGQVTPKSKSLISPRVPAENTMHALIRDPVTTQNLNSQTLVNHRVSPVRPTDVRHQGSALNFSTEVLPDTMELFPATVTHIDSGSKLFISLTDSGLQSELCQVMLKLNSPIHPLQALDDTNIGSICAAKYSQDDTWYRARIVEVYNQSTCNVMFVDYGNSEKTQISDLREIPLDLTKLPAQAICCCLSGYESSLDKAVPSASGAPDIVPKMQNELMNMIIHVKVVNRKQDSWIIEVHNKSGECINGLFLPPSSKTVPTPMLSDLIFEKPSEKEFDATFSYIKNLSDFYCQRCDRQELKELQSLSLKLEEEISKLGEDFHLDLKVNGIYASKFMGTWYRCVVEEVKMANVLIKYIDYGNSELIPANQLRPLDPTSMRLPVRTFKCKLHGVTPVQEDWNCPEMEQYLQILQQSSVHLVIETKEPSGTFVVSLFVVRGSEKFSVAEDLVDMGMAKFLQILPPKVDVKPDLPYPHGRHHQTPNVEEVDEDVDDQYELEIQRQILELQMQLQLSQQKKKQKY